jgi:hypothetical protein
MPKREKKRLGVGDGGTNEIVSPHLPLILYDSFHDDWRWGCTKVVYKAKLKTSK